MSRDFQLLRLTAAAASLNELDAGNVEAADWSAAAEAQLRLSFPDYGWQATAQGLCGEAGADQPRCRIHLLRDAGYTSALVSTSLHADQSAFVRELAELLGARAFDLQTGRVLD